MTPQVNRMLREMRDLMVRSTEPGIADRMDLLAMCLFEELLLMRDSTPQEMEYFVYRHRDYSNTTTGLRANRISFPCAETKDNLRFGGEVL